MTAGCRAATMASALGLMGIDLVYAFKRVGSLIYVLDAVVETGLLAWWTVSLLGP